MQARVIYLGYQSEGCDQNKQSVIRRLKWDSRTRTRRTAAARAHARREHGPTIYTCYRELEAGHRKTGYIIYCHYSCEEQTIAYHQLNIGDDG